MHRSERKKISRNTTLAEILEDPRLTKILMKYGLPCLHCPMASYEINILTIGKVAEAYGIKLKPLLKELNKVIIKG